VPADVLGSHGGRPPGPFDRVDRVVTKVLSRWSIPALRLALGVVFVWFGALKIGRSSPVSELVARTVYWFDPDWVVPALGIVEVVIGMGLIAGVFLRVVLLLFGAQMAGTFLTFVVLPHVCFRDSNPLLLTVEGEFVVKNLVLLAAGLVVGSTVRGRRARVQVQEAPEES
jgi:putative oxidoreductase